MDGPNVNWKTLNEFRHYREVKYPDCSGLIEFGRCALHVVHNSLKAGHTAAKWGLFEYMRDTYYFFNAFPSRKAEYTRLTNSNRFPKKFCQTRWIQNGTASLKAQEILSDLEKLASPHPCWDFQQFQLIRPPCRGNFQGCWLKKLNGLKKLFMILNNFILLLNTSYWCDFASREHQRNRFVGGGGGVFLSYRARTYIK